ncbi:MAG: calcium-binding protein, partial [Gammaproteobacteria bacterium]|nr:calcium-binding protein [Gammaproteobacteria bacterium]
MADTTQVPAPLSRTVFPFPKSRGANGQAGEANAQEYFQALSQAEDGFFPIGYNGQWHGGIHFGSQTGASLDQDGGIRCIADGQVIAYRIDREYPKVDYESCAAATYSRGFVLVRHRLQLPPAPQVTGEEAEATSNTSGEPSLVFYSLYMHLRNSQAYAADPCLRRPGFWDGSIHLVGERALDKSGNPFIPEGGMTGMNIRNEAHAIAGFAPRGVKLRLGEPHQKRGSYFRITEVVEGTTYPAEVVGMYVYKGTDTSREGLDAIASPHATDSVYIPPEPIDIKAGDIVGHLGEYQRYLDMDALAQCASGRPLAQVDVFTHEDLPAFVAQGRARDAQLEARQKTLLHIKPGAQLVQPSPPDIELRDGQAIYQIGSDTDDQWVKGRRGTIAIVDERPAGFTTATRTYGDGRIFLAAVDAAGNEISLEQFNALHDRSTHPRRKLFTPQGDEVWVAGGQANGQSLITGPARAWSQFPLQPANADGEPVGYSRVLPVSDAGHVVREADGTRWFQVDAGTRSGGVLRGWVRESGHQNVELCSPWAWPGFELFDVGELEPRDLFARELNNSRRAQPQEREEFESTARNVEQSPVFDALAKAIDADGNQQITPLELRRAMGTSWMAQAISRLVIRYPSEWSDPSNRWSRIDGLIEDEVLLRDWQHEKGRIQQLVIWPDVAGQHGFPS